jgi:prolyl-tRNA synthetase
MLKTIVFKVKSTPEDLAKFGEEWIVAVVRGDHDVNEGKVREASGCAAIELADPKQATEKGFAIGFVSPRAAVGKKGVLLLVDRDAAVSFDAGKNKPIFWVTGGDKKDYHVKHFNWQRDLGKDPLAAGAHKAEAGYPAGSLRGGDDYLMVADVRNALPGDPSPRSPGAVLAASRGIEVGHIFKLGTKYSDAMGLRVLDEKQQKTTVIMGCYGIGVSRTMAACVEMSHDANGILWPTHIAPYHVLLTIADATQTDAAQTLARELAGHGADVLIDDRDERPGPKFKDADLIGVPVRVVLGEKAAAAGGVEFKLRKGAQGTGEVVPAGAIVAKVLSALR